MVKIGQWPISAAAMAAALLVAACPPKLQSTLTNPNAGAALDAQREFITETILGYARTSTCQTTAIAGVERLQDAQAEYEIWTVDRCGEPVRYSVRIPVTQNVGTHVEIRTLP